MLFTSLFYAQPASAEPDDFLTACPQMTDSIYRLYSAYFLREPDNAGFDYWLATHGSAPNTNLDVVSDSFAISEEFMTRYGSLSNTEFVNLVYRNVLNRAPDPEGLNHWVNALNGGHPRGSVMIAFSESEEYVLKTGTTPPQAGFLMAYDRGLQYACNAGFLSVAGTHQEIIDIPSERPAYVDILIWNIESSIVPTATAFPGVGTLFERENLGPNEYIHIYNVPVPAQAQQVTLNQAVGSANNLLWSVVFHDKPHSADRPGWEGINWLG